LSVAAVPPHPAAPCAGLATAADPHHRALDAGWRSRHVRPPALRPFQRRVSRALLRREPRTGRRAERGRGAGGGGRIGPAAPARAPPDGYTLTTSSTAYHVIAPVLSPNPGFDPLKDFTH